MFGLWEAMGNAAAASEELAVAVPDPMPETEPVMTEVMKGALRSLRAARITSREIDVSIMLGRLAASQRSIMYYEGARVHGYRVLQHGQQLGSLGGDG